MKSVCVGVGLFIIMRVLNNVCGYIDCKSNAHCGWCGFCTDRYPRDTQINVSNQFSCYNPYYSTTSMAYKKPWVICKFHYSLCKAPIICKNNGVCEINKIYAGPVCKCNYSEGYMGQFCQVKWDRVYPDSWYSGFAVIFDNFKGTPLLGHLYSVTFIAAVFSSGKNLQFSLETDEGYVIRFNQSTDYSNFDKTRLLYPYKRSCKNDCGQYLPKCEIVFKARIQFPYKIARSWDAFVREGGVKGYVAQVTLVAKTLNNNAYQVVFRQSYPVVVEYEDLYIHEKLHHMPVIQLQNCGYDLKDRVFYFRRSAISLNARLKNYLINSIKIVWSLWDVQKFRNYYESSDISQIGRMFSWNFKPFSLNFTVYRAEIKVISYYHAKYTLANYADCYFEVQKLKVVAVISGGSQVTVNNKYSVIISGKNSYNPNVSKKDQDLNFVWRCTPQCDNLIHQYSSSNDEITIPKDTMDAGMTYKFTLNVYVSGFKDGWTFQEVYVSEQGISVFCLMNCLEKVVPNDPLLLEVRLPRNKHINRVFNWTKIEGSGAEVSADDVKCKNHLYPSYLLCVEPNALSYGEVYQFNAKLANTDAHAGIQVSVDSRVNFSCVVSPTKGRRLKTLFSISCSKPNNTQSSWVFEFFDKYSSDLDLEFSGRMIATNSLGVVRDFSLVRGIIVVYLFDVNGVITMSKHVVELASYNSTKEDIEYLLVDVKNLIENYDLELAIKKASLVSDLINDKFEKRYIAERMVQLISTLVYESQGIMKLGLRTVTNLITSLTKDGDFTFSQNMLSILAKTIESLMKWTTYALDISRTATPPITKYMFEQMATASVEAIETLITNRDESFLDTSLDDLSSSDYDIAREASRNIDLSLHKIGYALSFRQASGYVKSSIWSIPKQSSVTAKCDYFSIITTDTNKDEINPLKMSKRLMKDLSDIEELTIHLTSVSYNPFWASRRDISTILLSLDMYNRSSKDLQMTRVGYIKNYIDLFLDVENSTISSVRITVMQLDPLVVSMGDIDANLTVLRFDLASHSKLFMSFTFHNSRDEIKIFVSDTIRPNYDLVNTSKTIISSSNPNYAKTAGPTITGMFVYIGLLPGSNVPTNGSVNFTIHFYYQQCLTLHRLKWVPQYCRIGPDTNSSKVHCSCSHLSFFSAVVAVPPNQINPFTDIRLFLTLRDNWFIVVSMSCVVTVFFLLGVWARYKDTTDTVQRTVLVLEDNFAWDSNCYLLAVFTGCRINAGTTANVGVHIYGNESSSRCHILKSSKRKVLKFNSQDWFLFRTPQPLGNITKIHMWHDNSGSSPDWYCNKVIVYDLHTSVVYTFFVEEWLALESSEFCEAVIFPATSEDLTDIRRIVMDNITFGFRYVDLGCGILAPHPRSRVGRLVNVVVMMDITMMILLVSLLFYKYTTNPDNEGYDNFGFTFRTIDIIISIETLIITTIVIGIVSFTFTKAYKPKQEGKGRESVLYTRQPKRNPLWETISNASGSTFSNTSKPKQEVKGHVSVVYTRSSKNSSLWETTSNRSGSTFSNTSNKRKSRSYYYRLVNRVQTTYNRLPLSPVTLSSYKVKTNRILYCVAWLMSVVLITSCLFFIILYGLKLGQEESKTWLATISLILLQEFILISPLKIALVAILLASNYKRFVQISSFNVLVDEILEARHSNHITSNYDRTKSMYKPISLLRCNLLREKLRAKKVLYNLLDFLIVIAYIIIICLVTLYYSIDVQCHANFHAAQMVLLKHNPKHVNFQDLHNRSLYYDYLNINFANTLYATRWYNSDSLNPSGLNVQQRTKWWTMDKITKLVGPTMFRQIRVDPRKCSMNEITENSSVECIPNWRPDVEDDDDYGYGWKSLTYEDTYDKSSAWKYVLPSQSLRFTRQGETWTTYHGGGYMTSVSSDKRETEFTVQILTENMWINEFTRVVFLDFTLFNVNENMFTKVILIAEHLPFGLYVTRTMINSVQLDMVQSGWNVALILFIMIIVFHIIRMVWLMNREGFVRFCFKLVNIYQICVTSLGVLTVILYVCHLKVSVDYIERFQSRGFDVFFNFEEIIYYSVLSTDCLTVLFCCLCFRLLTLWPFGGSSRIMYRTLFICIEILARFLILIILYIYIFCRLISYLLSSMLPFSSFYWHWAKSVHKPIGTPHSMMVIILSFSVKLCFVYILLFFCYQYKLGKVKKENQSDLEMLLKYIRPTK